jgi:C4-dicarboxylate transporter DctM subunit
MSSALWALVGVLVLGMLLRMPIGFSMLVSGFAYLLVKRQDLGLVAEQVGNGLYNSYVLLAVPLFVFAANIMNAGTVSERIFDFCRIRGRAYARRAGPGGYSGQRDFFWHEWQRHCRCRRAGSGHHQTDAEKAGIHTWLCRCRGGGQRHAGADHSTLSIPMVIYALVSGASVGALLFLGGVVPGFLMAAC